MIILGIETSCDETALAVVEAEGGFERPHFRVLKNLVASQIKIHAPYGGVVPNLAKREHAKNLPILFKRLLGGLTAKWDFVAVTVGPGLEPCLWEGINFAQDMAKKYKKPIVAVNHMEGHLVSVLLSQNRIMPNVKASMPKIEFPAAALLVSGGHTELALMKNWLNYKIIGETLDDAAGEAFDKVARLLNLPYPGGPALAKLADNVQHSMLDIRLPRPMINSKDLNFSFSGLKTAVLYYLRENPKADKAVVSREFQNAVVDVLVAKTLKAVEKYRPKTLIIAGGVAANKHLQKELSSAIKKFPSPQPLVPKPQFTGDNAAMIAAAGYFHALKKDFAKAENLKASGRLRL